MLAATWLGCAAGMAPDLDVFIQSAQDPLLFLEFHRHFTHALLFIPFGAAIVASVLHYFARKRLRFRETYLVCLIGYATHGLLDACTSYGTQLFWPFSDMRVAWNNVSVVDPAFTVPLVILTIAAYRSQRHLYTYLGIGWVFGYLLLGFLQIERATTAAQELAQARGHTPTQLSMKPSFANLLIWKSIYAHDGYYYVDAMRTGAVTTVCPGTSVEKLDTAKHLPELRSNSQQARDLERFRWFSMDYLAPTGKPGEVTDMRYSMVPNQIAPMWGITLDANTDMNAHVQWWSRRDTSIETLGAFEALLRGQGCEKI